MALHAGPKTKHLKPLPLPLPAADWCELVTGQPLYQWQRDALEALAVDITDRPRVSYIQVARKNGKTRLAAMLALAEICLGQQRHVYAVSDSERNLRSVLVRELRDIIGASDYLRDSIHIFRDHIEVPETGSFIEARPGNFQASQGINPHLVLFDEVHLQKTEDVWYGMQMAGAARADALLFGITTPGYDLTSVAHSLYQQAKGSEIHSFIYESDSSADIDAEPIRRQGNPCYDMPGFAKGLEFDREHLPEHEFRRFRLGQWTATESAWLPYGVWDALATGDGWPTEGSTVWLGFDGSYSGDSTALIGVTRDLHVFVIAAWENPGRKGWRVPRGEVEDTIALAMERWKVKELLCDPPYWQREISEWVVKWPRQVVEFPTFSRARMAPACTAFYAACMDGALTHDGDPRLARHVANAIVKASPQGDYITKADKDSPAKIDLAVAAVIAFSRASVAMAKKPELVVL